MEYDLVVIGGGFAGSSLAAALASAGADVLVLERTSIFKDRVRGEGMHPWGVAEAKALGIYEAIVDGGGHRAQYWKTYRDQDLLYSRDLESSTPHRVPALHFYHPEAQETLLNFARDAGATVMRGARLKTVRTGYPPTVVVNGETGEHEFTARLVVGADGRQSSTRQQAGFALVRDPLALRISGVLLQGMRTPDTDSVHVFMPSTFGQAAYLFPIGRDRIRAYFMTGFRCSHKKLGKNNLSDFIAYSVETGIPREWFHKAKQNGPLATFEASSFWVEHPYRDGVVLIGDAANASDPCWGCGLALALRDVRVLRDALLSEENWSSAADKYASEHDTYSDSLHTIQAWLKAVLYDQGSEADKIREVALPILASGEGPDLVGRGPENRTDESARVALFGA